MLQFLIVAHVIIAVFLGVVVLIQPGKGGGLVMGGTSQTLFGATGAGNFFTKLTTVLIILLVLTSIGLTKAQTRTSHTSLFDTAAGKAATQTTIPVAPAAPGAAPAAGADAAKAPAAPDAAAKAAAPAAEKAAEKPAETQKH